MERFTKFKTMIFPREVIVGHNTTDQIKGICNNLAPSTNLLLVCDKNTKKISGDRIEKILSGAGYDVNMVVLSLPLIKRDVFPAWPTIREVSTVVKEAKSTNSDFFLGVGGGSVIDVTKCAAYELSKKNLNTLIIEKGHDTKEREGDVMSGVGGAGLFSDGKLNFTEVHGKTNLYEFLDKEEAKNLINEIDNIFIEFGAPKEYYTENLAQAEKISLS